MGAFKTRFWTELSWPEFRAADMGQAIAVLPVAAVEQHGPHLPVGVDSFIMDGYLERALPLLPDDLPVLVLPVQRVGKSNEHLDFPGTLTVSAATAIRAWTEIGESVHRAGVRKLVLVNSHGGNVPVLDVVARDLRVRFGMLAVAASWSRFGQPAGVFSDRERQHGIHAGEVETSLMLRFRPDLVAMGEALNFEPESVRVEAEFARLRVTQPVGFGWMAQDNHASGAMGDAAAGTAEKGEAAASYGAQAFVDLMRDVHAFDLARLPSGPLKRGQGAAVVPDGV